VLSTAVAAADGLIEATVVVRMGRLQVSHGAADAIKVNACLFHRWKRLEFASGVSEDMVNLMPCLGMGGVVSGSDVADRPLKMSAQPLATGIPAARLDSSPPQPG
jgi:hypothetical protein